ncbi:MULTISPECIES: XRE family transcriptional regulator [unclassified Sphingobacterium]|uniref:XRE family transcriptional regulator n=1 Tax=unclassified Sphingobacterium TaxID=2609468 RepID=UPI0020C46CD9|nr:MULTISPECIES: XRE family transcriptional regulator [unclassified Sphingobacterium]
MSDYQGDKFQKKLTELGISATEAAKRIEISRDTIHKWFKKEQLDHKQIVKITKGLGLSQDEIWGDDLSKPNAKPARFLGDGTPNMWVVPIKAQGGFLEGYGDSVLLEQNIEKVYFPFIGQECFAFEIDGLSMLTEYVPGEYFVGTPIENFNHLVKGRVYVFQTIDGIIIKEFVKIEDDYIHLRSQNEDYNPVKPIYLKDIKRVYQREMVIKN